MDELNLILLGPPGAGKGTQAERIREDYDLAYIATGDMLRQAVADGTELGTRAKAFMDAGDLVPDEVIIGVIIERVQGEDARDGFLLDASSRNPSRASSPCTRSMITPMMTSSGTRSPASMKAFARVPSSVPSATAWRSMSPVAMYARS